MATVLCVERSSPSTTQPRDVTSVEEKRSNLTKFPDTISVYLSGPITHVEPAWRYEAAEDLEEIGVANSICVQVYIPAESPEETDKNIISRDLLAIEKSDIVVAYVFSETFGTPMEIFYAFYILKRPVFIVCELRKVSPWLSGNSTKLFKTRKGFLQFWDRYLGENYSGGKAG